MKKIVSALGLLVALSLGAIAWIGGSDVMAHEGVAACETGQSAFDDGYGVSAGCVRRHFRKWRVKANTERASRSWRSTASGG